MPASFCETEVYFFSLPAMLRIAMQAGRKNTESGSREILIDEAKFICDQKLFPINYPRVALDKNKQKRADVCLPFVPTHNLVHLSH